MIVRARRLVTTTCSAIALAGASLAALPASGQIVFDGYQNSPGSDGTRAVCVIDGGLSLDDDNDCEGGLTGDDPQPIIQGIILGGYDNAINTYLGTDGKAYFEKRVELNGDTFVNGSIKFNGQTTFAGNTSYTGGLSADGITSTGGLTNTGTFTNNGKATVTDKLTADTIATKAIDIEGYLVVGAHLTGNNGATFSDSTSTYDFYSSHSLRALAGANVDMGGNVVHGVGDSLLASDAANKGYVDGAVATAQANLDAAIVKQNNHGAATAAALGGGSTYDPATGGVSAPTYTVGTGQYNSVGAALNAANTTGLANFHANSTKGDSSATGANAVAVGPASSASGTSSFAAGDSATASAAGAIAIGSGAKSTGANAVAIGAGATATGSVAVGVATTASNGGSALGDRATSTGTNSVALGADASATAANAVAIGNGSVAGVANTVSVGTAAATRRVVNVSAGVSPTDAANVAQLSASGASVAAALGGGSSVRADGTITAPTYTFGGSSYNNVADAFIGTSNRIDGAIALSYSIRQEARRGIAAATAMANAPMPSAPGRTSWAFNGATFHGEVAVGGSISHRFDTADPLAINAGFAYAKGGNNTVKVGMAGEF